MTINYVTESQKKKSKADHSLAHSPTEPREIAPRENYCIVVIDMQSTIFHTHTHACTHARTHARTHTRTHTYIYITYHLWYPLEMSCQYVHTFCLLSIMQICLMLTTLYLEDSRLWYHNYGLRYPAVICLSI